MSVKGQSSNTNSGSDVWIVTKPTVEPGQALAIAVGLGPSVADDIITLNSGRSYFSGSNVLVHLGSKDVLA